MHKVEFQPIPIKKNDISSRITSTDAQMDKFVELPQNVLCIVFE